MSVQLHVVDSSVSNFINFEGVSNLPLKKNASIIFACKISKVIVA